MRRTLQFLGFLTDSDIEWLLSVGQVNTLRNHQTLVSAGDVIDAVYILVAGRLVVTDPTDNSRFRYLGPGEVVGEISAKPVALTAKADLDSRVLRVRRADLVDKCEADEGFAERFEHVIQSLVSRRMHQALTEDEDQEGDHAETANTDSVELDAEMLDQITLAARKFDWIRASG